MTAAAALGSAAAQRLAAWGVCDIEPGLADAEFDRIEREFGFKFADDHRAFLAAGLPVNTGMPASKPGVTYTHPEPWPDWRSGSAESLRAFLGWPVEGVLLDVEKHGHWRGTWGARPTDAAAVLEVAKRWLADVPLMVPIYGHRYLPAGRGSFGHPVLSMWQTDIIYCGLDIADYIDAEFGASGPGGWAVDPQATVEFWRDYV